MAVIWQQQRDGNRYEVRTHGATVRLYTNGVFHTQWNPRDPLKGSLWELLLLPAFFLPPEQVKRVLLLGVGGGALIRLLQTYCSPSQILGVDIDPVHLSVAKRFFEVRDVELVCADARTAVSDLAAGDGAPFDLVVDDLFGHVDGEAQRAIAADPDWCKAILALVGPAGMVVSNFASRRELLDSGWRTPLIGAQLAPASGCWTLEHPEYENCIGVFSRIPLDRKDLKLHAPAALNPGNPARKLDARIRPLR
ncbi:methyltransferase domain-containing protein [Microbulbifer agarilyticus]|uniref:methyltransferase domain-containing protein n=1 Tax=Microbulbifer agarilyticus TaxID=260552 RepID=UPI001CD244D2|nr:methyltransferase domain-containing protein [Microbulbifer agarilyticus]MCA0901385.1 methyltransferase domain-containing protein [Microbulbifer agarilyticus]